MSNVKIGRFSDPAKGGKRVQFKDLDRTSTVEYPGYTKVTHTVIWRDVGTLMDEVTNHVEEQPTNRYKKILIERGREAARRAHAGRAPKGWSHAGSVEVHTQGEAS